jgi:hypothetical protein
MIANCCHRAPVASRFGQDSLVPTSPNFPKQIGGVGREKSDVGFYVKKKKCLSFHSSPQKSRLRLFSEPGYGKSELGYETAIFFDGRTFRETGRIGSCGSRSDEAEA